MTAALVLVIGALLTGWWLRRTLLAVTVTGRSMEPALRHGDRVLVRRAGVRKVRRGQLVILAVDDPAAAAGTGRTLVVKRAAALPGDPVPRAQVPALAGVPEDRVPAGALVVLGDNAALSDDSRRLGYLPADRLVGVVVRRLPAAPP